MFLHTNLFYFSRVRIYKMDWFYANKFQSLSSIALFLLFSFLFCLFFCCLRGRFFCCLFRRFFLAVPPFFNNCHGFLKGQFVSFFSFGNLVVHFIEGDVRSKTTVKNLYPVFKFLNFPVFLDFPFLVDSFDSGFKCYRSRVVNTFFQGNEKLIMLDVRSKTTDADTDRFIFEFTQLTGKLEQV